MAKISDGVVSRQQSSTKRTMFRFRVSIVWGKILVIT